MSCGDAGGRGDAGEVAAGRRRRREAADRQQALVVEHHMHEVARPVARERGEAAEVHQDRAVAVEHHDLELRPAAQSAMPRPIDEASPIACCR